MGLKTGGGARRANLSKKERRNGLVGAKNKGRGRPTDGKKRKQMY